MHDCERTEAAGVECAAPDVPPTAPPTTTPRPRVPVSSVWDELEVRLAGGRTGQEGRLEVRAGQSQPWGVVCGDGWGLREAVVACRHLGLGYAAAALETDEFGGGNVSLVVSGLSCLGNEESLLECGHDPVELLWCPGEGSHALAGVVCTDRQADLQPDLYQLITSAYLEDKPLFLLQCAMEENCLASQAYTEREENPYWQQVSRRLLR